MYINELFDKIDGKNLFHRVSKTHPLELYVGYNKDGQKTLEYRYNFIPQRVIGTNTITVIQEKRTSYNVISFSLLKDSNSDLFYKFCEDICECTEALSPSNDGYKTIVYRFNQWKKMFTSATKDLLDENQQMGLIGELLYLNILGEKIDFTTALNAWSGQDLTHKDFSYNNIWEEIKTIHSNKQTVKIASLEQLDGENGFLHIFALERMSKEYDGVSLNKLVLDTTKRFSNQIDIDIFFDKISKQGYAYSEQYDEYNFAVVYHKRYVVTSAFPKLIKSNIDSAIAKATYEITIDSISSFEV